MSLPRQMADHVLSVQDIARLRKSVLCEVGGATSLDASFQLGYLSVCSRWWFLNRCCEWKQEVGG